MPAGAVNETSLTAVTAPNSLVSSAHLELHPAPPSSLS